MVQLGAVPLLYSLPARLLSREDWSQDRREWKRWPGPVWGCDRM